MGYLYGHFHLALNELNHQSFFALLHFNRRPFLKRYLKNLKTCKKDINFYGAEVSEKVTKYKWFMEQYINLMNQYNAGIMPAAKPRQKPRESAPRQQRGEQ